MWHMSISFRGDLITCQFSSDLCTSNILYANLCKMIDVIEFGRVVTSPNVWSQLTQISENSAIHQHVVHYSSVSGLKRRRHLLEHINGHYLGYSKLCTLSNKCIHTKMSIHMFLPLIFVFRSVVFVLEKEID